MPETEALTLAQLYLKVKELETRLEILENGSFSKGYYLEGTPEYVKKYAKEQKLIGDIDE